MIYIEEGLRFLYSLILKNNIIVTGVEYYKDELIVLSHSGHIRLNYATRELDVIGNVIYYKDSVQIPAPGNYTIKIVGNLFIQEPEDERSYETVLR